jgi:hypothetical protein
VRVEVRARGVLGLPVAAPVAAGDDPEKAGDARDRADQRDDAEDRVGDAARLDAMALTSVGALSD